MKLKTKFAPLLKLFITSCISIFVVINATGCGSSSSTPEPEVVDTNTAPSITSTPVLTIESQQEYTYTLTATDSDGDALTMSATTLPAWLSFDSTTGVLNGTPQDSDEGDHSVTLEVSDGTARDTQSFTITVSLPVPPNNAPEITSTAILDATVGEAYSYTFTATDADGDVITMDSSELPSWLVFDISTGILSGTPDVSDVGAHAVTLTASDGTDSANQEFTITVVEMVATTELIIFDDQERTDWVAWDCCGGSTPTVETDDADHGATVEFSIGASPTVMGFTSRDADGATNGVPFDATSIVENGVFSFDLKMTASPGDTDWKFKIESTNAATAVEVNLSTSNEGHATPVLDTWQTYTFNLATLQAAGLDTSAIDVVMMFPAWDTGNGAVYRVDNVSFLAEGAVTPVANELIIFNDEERSDWPAWDCCGGSTPTLVTDTEATYGATMEFSIGATATVMGFTSREVDGAVDSSPFDATAIVADGILSFDLKMIASPGDTDWKLKVESNSAATAVEVDLSTSNEGHAAPVLDTWQHYSFNLSTLQTAGLDMSGIDVVMIFPAWNTGNGAIYRIDNLSFLADGAVVDPGGNDAQIDLPINFDEDGVDYTIIDFGGNSSVLGASPTDANDQVAITTKLDSAETWAGTTMSTNDGLATPVALTLTDSIMKVWVYSPDANIPVRLKLENHLDPTQTVETEALTTMVNTWEELTFDFTNEAPGTEPLNPTLHPDWIFDKASIFFNFGTDGATAGEKVYYWDDITF